MSPSLLAAAKKSINPVRSDNVHTRSRREDMYFFLNVPDVDHTTNMSSTLVGYIFARLKAIETAIPPLESLYRNLFLS